MKKKRKHINNEAKGTTKTITHRWEISLNHENKRKQMKNENKTKTTKTNAHKKEMRGSTMIEKKKKRNDKSELGEREDWL